MAKSDKDTNDDSSFEFKFFVCLDDVSLNNQEPLECTIKFKYDLFSHEEVQYPPFMISGGGKFDKIPGHHVFIISREKDSDIKKYLEENLLKFQIYNKDVLLGVGQTDLSPFSKNEVDEMPFGLKHQDQIEIIGSHNDRPNMIGLINC